MEFGEHRIKQADQFENNTFQYQNIYNSPNATASIIAMNQIFTTKFMQHDILFVRSQQEMLAAVVEGNLEKVRELVRSHGKLPRNFGCYLFCKALEKKHVEVALFLLREVGVHVNNGYSKFCCSTPIHLAVMTERLDVVKEVLKKRTHVDTCNSRKQTPLHLATERRNKEIVDLLLRNGANVNAKDVDGNTALSISCRSSKWSEDEDEKIALILLNNQADIDTRDNRGCTPLHYAIKSGNRSLVELLIERKANVNLYTKGNFVWFGSSPLHIAAGERDEHIALLLLNNNAFIDAKDHEGSTPLHRAVENHNLLITKTLLSLGANVNATDSYNRSPLHFAILQGHGETVKKLLENGADVNITDNNKKTPLYLAAEKGSAAIVQEILQYNPNAIVPSLHISVKLGFRKIVECLLNHGANPDGVHDGCTLLHIAIENDYNGIVESLIKFKCDVTAKSKGKSPICFAVERRQEGIVELILKTGVNLEDELGLLHTAVKMNSFEICKLLINGGMDVNACDQYDRRPLHYADTKETIKLLCLNGADMNAKDENGQTALHLAVDKEFSFANAFIGFVEYDTDLDVQDNDGNTPLHLAVLSRLNSSHIAVDLLLTIGCDINITNNLGKTALDYAIREMTQFIKPEFDIRDLIEEDYHIDEYDEEYPTGLRSSGRKVYHFRNHITKLQEAGLYVSEKNLIGLRSFISLPAPSNFDERKGYHQACQREMEKIRCRKLDNNISLYNALIKCNVPKLRPELIKILDSFDYKKFPIYRGLMKTNLKRCEQRSKLICLSVQSFHTINRGKKLPIEVIEKIICELSNTDLKNLISCNEEIKDELENTHCTSLVLET